MAFDDRELLEHIAASTHNPNPRPEWERFGVRGSHAVGAIVRRPCVNCKTITDGRVHCQKCRRVRNGRRQNARKQVNLAARAHRWEFLRIARQNNKEKVMRERLEDTREGVVQKFRILVRKEDGTGVDEVKGHIHVGLYPDGRLGEVFVKVGKPGSDNAYADQWAIAVSMLLQHGVPIDDVFRKFVGAQFGASGAVQGVAGVLRCTSLTDLVARYILLKFGTPVQENP